MPPLSHLYMKVEGGHCAVARLSAANHPGLNRSVRALRRTQAWAAPAARITCANGPSRMSNPPPPSSPPSPAAVEKPGGGRHAGSGAT